MISFVLDFIKLILYTIYSTSGVICVRKVGSVFMKKNSLIVTSILVTCCLILLINCNYYEEKIIADTKTKNILNTNSLTMMYETDYQSGEYQVSSDTSWPQSGYSFNEELSKCENGSILTWNEESKKVLMQANTSDKCYVYFDKEPETLANYIINNVYTGTDGDNGLYYHDGVGGYTNADQEAGDNSYRYSGANPNNYVCFGSDEHVCPDDNLYRIIGVFGDKVKLIKKTSYGNYVWGVNNNTWNETTKPDIYTTLNTNYYNTLSLEWQNLISETTWQVGGTENDGSRKEMFDAEMGESQLGYEETMKIGLMYISDYGYAADPYYWTTALFNYNTATSTNWLYLGDDEWTITRYSKIDTASGINNNLTTKYYISFLAVAPPTSGVDVAWKINNGQVYGMYTSFESNIRPTFYLNSGVAYISGTGTPSDPYRIN